MTGKEGADMIIGIGNDHTAIALKNEISEYLQALGHEVNDFGVNDDKSVDYPLIAEKTVVEIGKTIDVAVLICGTGIGMSLAANKIKGIRAAVGSDCFSAKMAKAHNNCQVLCLGARTMGSELAKMVVSEWLSAEFMGERHAKRVEMISRLENGEKL